MNTEKNKLFLQLQSCMLLLLLTTIPDFNLFKMVTGVETSIVIILTKLFGIAGSGYALFKLYNMYQTEKNVFPIILLACSGLGSVFVLVALFSPDLDWLEYIALIILAVALYTSKKSLNIEWPTQAVQGAYIILMAAILYMFESIEGSFLISIAALVGLILYLKGLGMLKNSLDDNGTTGAAKLKIAIILGLVGVGLGILLGWVPLVGGIIPGILGIIAFIMEYMGYGWFMKSSSLGLQGQAGAGKLRISMILLLVSIVLGWIPVINTFSGILGLVAFWFIYQGWTMIVLGIEENATILQPKEIEGTVEIEETV